MNGRFLQNNDPRVSTGTLLVLVLLFASPGFAEAARPPAQPVSFVVGDYLQAEGGDWAVERSPLRSPFGIDFDEAGAMYVIELTRGCLHRILPSGELETWREAHPPGYGGDGGPVAAAAFNGPHNCVVAADNGLLIADSWNHCVRRVDLTTRVVATLAGTGTQGFSGDSGPARAATFDYVMCIELDPGKKVLHIADLRNRRVRNLDLATGLVRTVAGNGRKAVPAEGGLAAANPLVDPRAVTSDAEGHLYILERGGHALRVVQPDGRLYTVAGTGQKGYRDGAGRQAQFGGPKHMCCDPDGNVYIADDLNRAVRKFDPHSKEVSTVLGRGCGDPRITLEHPHGVRWHAGSLYVADTGHNRILRWTLNP
jgi:hypothetical protein